MLLGVLIFEKTTGKALFEWFADHNTTKQAQLDAHAQASASSKHDLSGFGESDSHIAFRQDVQPAQPQPPPPRDPHHHRTTSAPRPSPGLPAGASNPPPAALGDDEHINSAGLYALLNVFLQFSRDISGGNVKSLVFRPPMRNFEKRILHNGVNSLTWAQSPGYYASLYQEPGKHSSIIAVALATTVNEDTRPLVERFYRAFIKYAVQPDSNLSQPGTLLNQGQQVYPSDTPEGDARNGAGTDVEADTEKVHKALCTVLDNLRADYGFT